MLKLTWIYEPAINNGIRICLLLQFAFKTQALKFAQSKERKKDLKDDKQVDDEGLFIAVIFAQDIMKKLIEHAELRNWLLLYASTFVIFFHG